LIMPGRPVNVDIQNTVAAASCMRALQLARVL
jgi:hypothetical protein